MIVLFTDFGLHGPYTGQVKAVLHQMAPGIPAIDLFADASQETLPGQMRLGMLALAVARVVEHCRWRARATKRPVVPDVNPASPAGPRQPRRAS